ncbi:hypothetical protein KIN20_011763, partial [Parelaphostrongylus tenuis]
VTAMNNRTPLLLSRQRAISSTSFDPYEDPVAMLKRVSSSPRFSSLSRRRRELGLKSVKEYLDEEKIRLVKEYSERKQEKQHAFLSTYESLLYEISANQLYRYEEGHLYHHIIFFVPVAGGSGIPQIKCYLNVIWIPEVVKLKTPTSKAVGVVCSVGGDLLARKV